MGLIYKATNPINNKSYIGQTIHSLQYRQKQHLNKVLYENSTTHFHNAIRKYGIDQLEWTIIHANVDNKDLNELEILEIKNHNTYPNGYNSTPGGDSNPMSNPSSVEKMRQKLIGRKIDSFSEIHKQKLSQANLDYWKSNPDKAQQRTQTRKNNGNLYHSPQTREKLSIRQKEYVEKVRSRGQLLPYQKLTKEQVIEIRRLYLKENISTQELANRFQVTKSAVQGICNGNKRTEVLEYLDDIKKKVTFFKQSKRYFSLDEQKDIMFLSKQGISNKELALKFKTSSQQIWRIIKRNSVSN